MGYFAQKRGRPTGIPWPARGGEKKMGPAWRPWPGLAEVGLSGEKKRIPQKRESIFFPAANFIFFPRGKKNGFICNKAPYSGNKAPYWAIRRLICNKAPYYQIRRLITKQGALLDQ